MKYKIEKKASFTVTGYMQEMTKVKNNENFYEISRFWSNLTEAKINQLMSISDGTIPGFLGVSDSNKRQLDTFQYMIGTSSKQQSSAKKPFENSNFPASDWAVFECIGAISAGITAIDESQPFEPNVLMQLKSKISSLLVDDVSIVENTELPRVEFYSIGNMESEEYRCELWIPIRDVKK